MSSRDRANAGMRASNIANSLGVNDPRIRRGMQLPEALKLGQGLRIDDKGRIALDFSALSVEGTREILNQINSVVRIDRAITIDKTVTTENEFDDDHLLQADIALGEDIGSLYSTQGSMQGDISYALGELLTLASSLATQGTSISDLAGRVSTLEGYHTDDAALDIYACASQDKYDQNVGLDTTWRHKDLGDFPGESDPNDIISYSSSNDRVDLSDGIWSISCDAWGMMTSGSQDKIFMAKLYTADGDINQGRVDVDSSARDHSQSCHFSGVVDARGSDKWVKFAVKTSSTSFGSTSWVGAHVTYHQIG